MLAYSILFFFFISLLTDFVEAVYAFGLLGVGLPTEMALILLFFSPLVLLFFKHSFSTKTIVILGEIVILAGAIDPLLDTRLRMFVSGFGLAVFLIYLPALLVHIHQYGKREETARMASGLMLAVLATIVLRAWVSGINPSGTNFGQLLGLVLAVGGTYLLVRSVPRMSATTEVEEDEDHPVGPTFWKLTGLATGITACLLVVYFALQSPHVMARWANLDTLMVVVMSVLAMVLFSGLWMFLSRRNAKIAWGAIAVWNALFVIATTAALLPLQIQFPSSPAGYPLFQPEPSNLTATLVYAMILLSPVILVDFWLYAGRIIKLRPTLRKIGGAFSLAGLFWLIMIIFQIGTTVYDYIPVVGPLMRDRYWLVFTLLAVVMGMPIFLLSRDKQRSVPSISNSLSNLTAIMGTAAIAGVMLITASPAVIPAEPTGTLRVVTYNIQQAYGADGQKSHVDLVDLMHQLSPDIIGLQETDSARIAGGNSDLLRYFSDHLGYFTYPGPGVVPGTFGVALLSRYPIENARTFYMYSEGEQTASILAEITVEGTTYTVLVTHLGNQGPIVQQEAVLAVLDGRENILAMGDFNFRPDTEQYLLTTQTLDDSWVLRWPAGEEVTGFDPARRIDYVFVSTGIEITDAQFLTGPESDHPGYMIEVATAGE